MMENYQMHIVRNYVKRMEAERIPVVQLHCEVKETQEASGVDAEIIAMLIDREKKRLEAYHARSV